MAELHKMLEKKKFKTETNIYLGNSPMEDSHLAKKRKQVENQPLAKKMELQIPE